MDQSTRSSNDIKRSVLASVIDYTNLKPDATKEQIKLLCEQAKAYGFYAVCINPIWIEFAKGLLEHSPVKICTVIGFPLGANLTSTKSYEASQAVVADELDMVMNIGAAKEGDWRSVESDIRGVVDAADGRVVKVILETCLLTNNEIQEACKVAVQAGAQFVKTSTGFSKSGVTIEVIQLMKEVVPPTMGIKASGGIKTAEQAEAMLRAGATRIGTSSII